MPAATKSRPKQARKKAGRKPSAKAAEITDVPTTTMDLPVVAISACPFQPRQNFPQDEIERLGESILADGLIHPVSVRPDPEADGYQLVDGERRLRACRWLGRETIRAEVGEWTDAQVMRIVVASAMQRRDLNPIEEALAFQRAIEAGVAAGPTELARQLGVSQGHVSNRIRLLELPKDFKDAVISGEIPPTHARSLVKFRECPAILERVAEAIDYQWDEIYHCKCTVDEFDENVERIAEAETRPLTGKWKSEATLWKDVPIFKASEEQLAELMPIELEINGKPQQRAANVDLWEKLQAEYMASRDAAAEKKAEKAATKKKGGKTELSPAEKKAAAAEEKRKAKEREKQFQKRLGEWYDHWLRYLIAQRLAADATMQELLVVAAYATTVHRWGAGSIDPMAGLKDACKALAPDVTIGTKREHFGNRLDVMASLVQLGEDEIEPVLGRTIAKWFWDDGPVAVAYAEDLEPLVTYLVIDRLQAWSEDQAGPLSLAYWNLHNKEQLLELGNELGVEVEASAKKTDLVDRFMARNDLEVEPLAMPKELQNLKTS